MSERDWIAVGLAIAIYVALALILLGRRLRVPPFVLMLTPLILIWLVFTIISLATGNADYAWTAAKLSLPSLFFYFLIPGRRARTD